MSSFLLTPLGIASLVAILAASLINIYAKFIDDSLADRCICSCLALVSLAALLHVSQGELPNNAAPSLVALLAIRQVISVWFKVANYFKVKKYARNHR